MALSARSLAHLYSRAHDMMRNVDGLQPQEAFDELLKYLFFKQLNEEHGPTIAIAPALQSDGSFGGVDKTAIKALRSQFQKYLSRTNAWSKELWHDKEFRLSDEALASIHCLFSDISFREIPFDIRSTALNQFVPPEIRRGLGIFVTPDPVVRMMVKYLNPCVNQKVYDPACGTGTFLIETIKLWRKAAKKGTVWGTDKNPRMLLLAELNLGHLGLGIFHRRLMDALFDVPLDSKSDDWPMPNYFDVILTNPPFGVILEGKTHDLSRFSTCHTEGGLVREKQQSEIVFLEQSLRLLKPGGKLGIVLPKSVATNSTFKKARESLGSFGYIDSIVVLPPETFHSAGTQTTTIVLFVKKYDEQESHDDKTTIVVTNVTNVGYDATGRSRSGGQLDLLPKEIATVKKSGKETSLCRLYKGVDKKRSFEMLPELLAGKTKNEAGTLVLGDIVEAATTGRTPARKNYTDRGMFLVKVGNLTGNGLNWIARDRNFVDDAEAEKRRKARKTLILKPGDILLTSSAHSPVYIAKKSDIVTKIPEWVGGEASFVGEVMLLRPKADKVDPFVLLAFLRLPETIERIQRLTRGQTAHLHPDDLLNLHVPSDILKPVGILRELADLIRQESKLAEELNELSRKQNNLIDTAA